MLAAGEVSCGDDAAPDASCVQKENGPSIQKTVVEGILSPKRQCINDFDVSYTQTYQLI